MDYKNALKEAEKDIYNTNMWMSYKVMEAIAHELLKYKGVKRLNATHCEKITESLKDCPGFRSVSITRDEHFKEQYKFHWYYKQMQWIRREPREEYQKDWITVSKEDLSGEAIYKKIKERLDYRKQYPYQIFELTEFEKFYEELKSLCSKHACAEKALRYLITR